MSSRADDGGGVSLVGFTNWSNINFKNRDGTAEKGKWFIETNIEIQNMIILVIALDGTYWKGGSLGDVPQNWTLNNKNSIYFGLLIHCQESK
jgi:hypothetical protein